MRGHGRGGPVPAPADVQAWLLAHAGEEVDLELTYALWHSLLGLDRAAFELATRLWLDSPQDCPIMTAVVDVQWQVCGTIRGVRIRGDKPGRPVGRPKRMTEDANKIGGNP